MLSWFLRLLGIDRRAVFRFWDGRKWRRIDPLETMRRLFMDPSFDWDETPTALRQPGVTFQLAAFGKIAGTVRRAFELPEFEAGGLTEIECWHLLEAFYGYFDHVKKNGSLMPTWPSPTAATSGNSLADVPFPTKPGSVSGPTTAAPSPEQLGLQAVPTSA